MTALPALDLSDFAHPLSSREWVYGPRRTDWAGGHPIVAVGDPEPGEPVLELRYPMGLERHELPHLAAWLLAVHAATEPAWVDPITAHRVDDPFLPDLIDDDNDRWFWGRDGDGEVGYVCVGAAGGVLTARTRAELDEEYGPLTEQAQPRQAGAA